MVYFEGGKYSYNLILYLLQQPPAACAAFLAVPISINDKTSKIKIKKNENSDSNQATPIIIFTI